MTSVVPAWTLTDAVRAPMFENKCDLLFVYGILKRGFELDLRGKAKFIDTAQLDGAILYRVGSGVGLRFTEDVNRTVYGEVFKIPKGLWKWLDMIESNGFAYTRRIVEVGIGHHEADIGWVKAWVYEHTFPNMRYDRPIIDGIFTY